MENFSEKRLSICKECPLYKNDGGEPRCNNKKWMDPETGKISYIQKPGYVKGCNCIIKMKVNNPSSKCPAKKW